MDRTTDAAGRRWTLFNNLLRDDLGNLDQADGSARKFADVAQLAEHDHAMCHG
jgi:hypothetical protein